MNAAETPPGRLRLGLPAWAFPGWRGRYFDNEPSALASYARVFDAVEGNTTFYRVPDAGDVDAWRRGLADRDCRISFKLPRSVTHAPRVDERDLTAFLRALEPLRDRLGPLLVQFPASAGLGTLQRRAPLFERIVERFAFVVEVRDAAFFDASGDARDALHDLLRGYGAGRAVLDASALHAGDATHPAVVSARHEKPLLPLPEAVPGDSRFVRLVLHPDAAHNAPWLDRWARGCAAWLVSGIDVTMTIHCPDNAHCPPFARAFHERLRESLQPRYALPSLPDWPIPQQDALF